ncbi:hypothetical protein Mapa_003864 [Marchantia paleacea]|nr:hypothetical protein Mapa_003864 [Marchantia paleacea]
MPLLRATKHILMRSLEHMCMCSLRFLKHSFYLVRDSEVKVPMAPELGLFLEECYYSSYNSKFGKLHEEVSLVDLTTDVRKFKHEVIYPHIASTEASELIFASWVQRINDEHFSHFALAREKENLSKAVPK